MTQAEVWQEPLFISAPSQTTSVLDVELCCLECGRGRQLTVATLAYLPPLPAQCTVCGGSILAVDSTTRVVRYAGSIDWSQGKPRRGRPPAHPRPIREETLP